MRSTVVWVIAIGGASFAGCRFDREPLSRESAATREVEDAAVSAPPDTSVSLADADTGDAAAVSVEGGTADAGVRDAASPLPNDAALDAGSHADFDASSVPEPPPMPPMTGGLSCAGTFCAFGVDPERPCCTTAEDVAQRTARDVDRCGLDLSGFAGAPYGTGCWQRDQLGILDERCPDLPAANGAAAEPGCCSDDGVCGTINAGHNLGCRYQTGSAPRACAAEPAPSSCDPTGAFAVRFRVDSTWGGRSGGLVGLTDDGRGPIEVYILLRVDAVDAATAALETRGQVCGVVLPPFYSTTLCEAYQPIFPARIWESRALPPVEFQGRYECAANGCVLSLDPATYLLGFSMDNPEAPWPVGGMMDAIRCREGEGQGCFPDHDRDDRAGVGVELVTEGTTGGGRGCRDRYRYRGAPLSASIGAIFGGVRRADRLALGVRTKFGAAVRLADDCESASGSAIAEYVNSRAAGCLVEPGSGAFQEQPAGDDDRCEPEEEAFIDVNLPVYQVLAAGETPNAELELVDASESRGPEVDFVRLGRASAAVSCEDVRNAGF